MTKKLALRPVSPDSAFVLKSMAQVLQNAAEAAASAAREAAVCRGFRRVAARPARQLALVAQVQVPMAKPPRCSTSEAFRLAQARSRSRGCTPQVGALESVRSRGTDELNF